MSPAVSSSNDSTHKHFEQIRKLSFRDYPLAELKTLSLISKFRQQAEDFPRVFEANKHVVFAVLKIQATAPLGGGINARVWEAMKVCWVSYSRLSH